MFYKAVVSTTLLALAAVAAANGSTSCNTGPIQCCDSTSNTVTPAISSLFALLGIDASSVALPIGVTCSPITVIGVGSGSTCTAQTVCCENNSFNGVVALGCTPINISL